MGMWLKGEAAQLRGGEVSIVALSMDLGEKENRDGGDVAKVARVEMRRWQNW
jgi:hypothetical protein